MLQEINPVYQNLQETRSPCYGQEAGDEFKGENIRETEENVNEVNPVNEEDTQLYNDVISMKKIPLKLSQQLSSSSNLSEMYLTMVDPEGISSFNDSLKQPVYDNYNGLLNGHNY